MVIDFSQVITDLTGAPLKENGAEVTLGVVAAGALMLPDTQATEAENLARFKVAHVIATATGPVTLTIDDAALIKKQIGKHPWPLIVGRAYELLEKETKCAVM